MQRARRDTIRSAVGGITGAPCGQVRVRRSQRRIRAASLFARCRPLGGREQNSTRPGRHVQILRRLRDRFAFGVIQAHLKHPFAADLLRERRRSWLVSSDAHAWSLSLYYAVCKGGIATIRAMSCWGCGMLAFLKSVG